MNSSFESSFIFVVCQVGAEPALKKEIARDHPELRFAYSKPGFVTFKKIEGKVDLHFVLRSVFARAYGVSSGAISSVVPDKWDFSPIIEFANELQKSNASQQLRLHLWERDQHAPGESPLGFEPGALANAFAEKFHKAFAEKSNAAFAEKSKEAFAKKSNLAFAEAPQAEAGDTVMDIVVLGQDSVWMGAHIHSLAHSPWPGGALPLKLPEESPSRAYLKLEESLLWAGNPTRSGDTALELGSAPGGASFALLKRGLKVVGIDPGEMAPIVLRNSNFIHFQRPVAKLPREELPDSIQWLLSDMNVEPRISLVAADRLVHRTKDTLLGVILTIKLNRWEFADEIPSMLDHVKQMGMVRVKAAQLSHHRQEIVVFGLTRKGLSRKGVTPKIIPRNAEK